MILLGVVLGIATGLILKGKLENLTELKLRSFYLVFLSLLIQLAILTTPLGQLPWVIENGALIYMLSLDLLLLGLLHNWRLGWSFRLVILGATLNLMVIAFNGGTIPVDLNKLSIVSGESVNQLKTEFESHTRLSYRAPLENSSTLPWLGDVIYLPVPLLNENVYSLGDICLSLGLAWFEVLVLRGKYHGLDTPASKESTIPIKAS